MAETKAIEKSQQSQPATTDQRDEQVSSYGPQWTYRPNVDIVESPDSFLIFADVPGAAKESIDLSIERDSLTIQARVAPRMNTARGAAARLLRQEYGVGSFHRRFRLSEAVDASAVHAEYRNGVLAVRLPKVRAAQRRQIPVTG